MSSTKRIDCPVCTSSTFKVGDADYYTKSSRFKTPIYWCKSCDSFYRDVNQSDLVEHYYAASYVNLDNEDKFLQQRQDFFSYLLDLPRKYLPTVPENTTLADFGSAYGHLLEIANKKGFQSVGVELNQELVKYCNQKGLTVVDNLEKIENPVDIFTIIDSLYCVPQPRETISQIVEKVKPGGLIIARVTNRNHYARIRNFFKRDNNYSILGDATVSFSVNSVRKLLTESGLEVIKCLPDTGQSKEIANFTTRAVYNLSALATNLTANSIILSPGVIVIARKP
jgi:2-polyprenyl-3-methyl-5-hydroxy-6-metoxy-1,4-benzoquinol methylase